MELDKTLRAQGGKSRAHNQSPEDRRLLAMIAASRRPLLHDVNLTPETLVRQLKELQDSRHWFCSFIVVANGDRILYTSESDVLRKLEQTGAPIGFLAVTLLKTNVQAYYKPLKRGVKVIETLDRVSRDVVADVLAHLEQVKLPVEG